MLMLLYTTWKKLFMIIEPDVCIEARSDCASAHCKKIYNGEFSGQIAYLSRNPNFSQCLAILQPVGYHNKMRQLESTCDRRLWLC